MDGTEASRESGGDEVHTSLAPVWGARASRTELTPYPVPSATFLHPNGLLPPQLIYLGYAASRMS